MAKVATTDPQLGIREERKSEEREREETTEIFSRIHTGQRSCCFHFFSAIAVWAFSVLFCLFCFFCFFFSAFFFNLFFFQHFFFLKVFFFFFFWKNFNPKKKEKKCKNYPPLKIEG